MGRLRLTLAWATAALALLALQPLLPTPASSMGKSTPAFEAESACRCVGPLCNIVYWPCTEPCSSPANEPAATSLIVVFDSTDWPPEESWRSWSSVSSLDELLLVQSGACSPLDLGAHAAARLAALERIIGKGRPAIRLICARGETTDEYPSLTSVFNLAAQVAKGSLLLFTAQQSATSSSTVQQLCTLYLSAGSVARPQVHEEVVVDAGVALIGLSRSLWTALRGWDERLTDVVMAQKDLMDRARHRPRARVVQLQRPLWAANMSGVASGGSLHASPAQRSWTTRESDPRGDGGDRLLTRWDRSMLTPSLWRLSPAALVLHERSEADPAGSKSARRDAPRDEPRTDDSTASAQWCVARASLASRRLPDFFRDGPEVHWQSVLRLEAFHASGRSLPLGLLQKIHSPSDLRALRTIHRLAAHHAPAHSLR